MPKQIYFWAAVLWTIVIAFLCLVSFKDLPSVSVQNADKYVHFTLHFVFTGLWILYLSHKKSHLSIVKICKIVFLISVFYGISIEIMQELFTTTRKADIFDVCANATGSLIAISIIMIYQRFIAKNKTQ